MAPVGDEMKYALALLLSCTNARVCHSHEDCTAGEYCGYRNANGPGLCIWGHR